VSKVRTFCKADAAFVKHPQVQYAQHKSSSHAVNPMPSPAPSVKSVLSPIVADMQQLDQVIRASLHSEVSLINQISDYIINAGGKRLRPALVILTARALGATPQQMAQAIELAAIVEFIHTATLLHEEATNTIAEGEVLQLLNCKDPDVTEDRYMQVIDFKTAKLFEASCRLAGIVTGQDKEQIANLGRFGAEVGSAFQLIDDVLDYAGESTALGKNVGDDLREGKPTLPLIHAMLHAKPQIKAQIRDAIANGGTQDVSGIMASIEETNSLAYTRSKALALARSAKTRLGVLSNNQYSEALETLCDVAVNRNS